MCNSDYEHAGAELISSLGIIIIIILYEILRYTTTQIIGVLLNSGGRAMLCISELFTRDLMRYSGELV